MLCRVQEIETIHHFHIQVAIFLHREVWKPDQTPHLYFLPFMGHENMMQNNTSSFMSKYELIRMSHKRCHVSGHSPPNNPML